MWVLINPTLEKILLIVGNKNVWFCNLLGFFSAQIVSKIGHVVRYTPLFYFQFFLENKSKM